MRKVNIYIIVNVVLFITFSCSTTKNEDASWNKLVVGEWVLINPSNKYNYPDISFYNKTVIFDRVFDTLLGFRYTLKQSELRLTDINKVDTRCEILKLTRDSLIFKSLFENNAIQRYKRIQR
jgi:hypothetical protein